MNNPCDAVWLYVAAIWSAAALASIQTAEVQAQSSNDGALSAFDISTELDLDLALAGGDLKSVGDDAVIDVRFRFEAETFRDNGQRWGFSTGIAANTGDGRRGFSQIFPTGPQSQGRAMSGLATGWVGGADLDPGNGRIELSVAELFLKTRWLEWSAGLGQTAAAEARQQSPLAMRLTRADGAISDLIGGGLSHTGLSLSAPAPRIHLETRRIIGIVAAASYAPEAVRCGVEVCRPGETLAILSPDIHTLISLAANFDRRQRSNGVRWRAGLSLERAQVEAAAVAYEDPWIFSADASRERDGVTLSMSYLITNDGFADNQYEAIGFSSSIERGDWLYSIEIAHGDNEIFEQSGGSYAVGASRWFGSHALLSFGVLAHESGGVGALVETGLRF